MKCELNSTCPVCGWSGEKVNKNFVDRICPCCAFEYGKSDLESKNSFESWRNKWVEDGCPFRFPQGLRPQNWNEQVAWEQMKVLGKVNFVHHFEEQLKICPVCGWDGLLEPPYNKYGEPSHEICACCRFEFGYTDSNSGFSFEKWRTKWINDGYKFDYPKSLKKEKWSKEMAIRQLKNVKKVLYKPRLH